MGLLLSRFAPYLIVLALIAGAGAVYSYGVDQYAKGRTHEVAKYEKQISELKSVVNVANIKAIEQSKSQARQSRDAQIILDKSYKVTETKLNQAEIIIRKRQHESKDICVNRAIPDNFR